MKTDTDVLIVGAGPTGLVLALWLTRLGVRVRIIDKAEPATTSRAMVVQARTLEFYRQIGLAEDVVERGLKWQAFNVWSRGRVAGRIPFGDIGQELSPYPYLLAFPQDQHERLLITHLRSAGVEVERLTTLLGLEDRGDQVIARLRRSEGPLEIELECRASYVAGCDGARSRTREVLDIGFPGGTYARAFFVADVKLRGECLLSKELHSCADETDYLSVFPMPGDGHARLIGTVPGASEEEVAKVGWSDVSHSAERMRLEIEHVNWFSTYQVHHRVADRFRRGRVFLLGDAAHIHSPAGGQGMNTGIGDAVNLAWKLTAVLGRRADASLLDTYEPERITFARRLLISTDRVFVFLMRDGLIARWVRRDLMPIILPMMMRRRMFRRAWFRAASQTLVNYRHSALSDGRAGAVRGGDRLPWVMPDDGAGPDNFTPLTSIDWQLHVYGEPSPELTRACAARALPLHAFAWRPRMREAGLKRDAAYLVRPDGYVAWADSAARPAGLQRYLDERGVRLGAAVSMNMLVEGKSAVS